MNYHMWILHNLCLFRAFYSTQFWKISHPRKKMGIQEGRSCLNAEDNANNRIGQIERKETNPGRSKDR